MARQNARPTRAAATAVEAETGARPPPATRKPFGLRTQKLSYPTREGYHRHWFNDDGDRIARATEAGYSFVTGDDGKRVSRHVGKQATGQPQIAFLMEIRKEWYDADQALVQAEVDKVDHAIKAGKFKENPGDNRYIPATGIHYDPRGGR